MSVILYENNFNEYNVPSQELYQLSNYHNVIHNSYGAMPVTLHETELNEYNVPSQELYQLSHYLKVRHNSSLVLCQ